MYCGSYSGCKQAGDYLTIISRLKHSTNKNVLAEVQINELEHNKWEEITIGNFEINEDSNRDFDVIKLSCILLYFSFLIDFFKFYYYRYLSILVEKISSLMK